MKIRKDLIIAIVCTFCLTLSMFGAHGIMDMGRPDFLGGGTTSADTDTSIWRCERASLWISAASFEQWNYDYFGDYYWGGGFLDEGAFHAQVQLPDGVIIKNMTCIGFGDSNASEVVMEVSLTGDNLSEWRGPWPNLHMAQAGNWHIDNDPLWSRLTGYDDTIDCNQIDNEHCIYWVYVRMHQFSSAKESLVGVRIDYEIPY